MPEELPRRYVTICRCYDGNRSGPVSLIVRYLATYVKRFNKLFQRMG